MYMYMYIVYIGAGESFPFMYIDTGEGFPFHARTSLAWERDRP